MNSQAIADKLRNLPEMSHLREEHIETLAAAMTMRRHLDGHLFFSQGDKGAGIFLILDGDVAVTQDREGERTELRRMGPGTFFGILSVVDKKRRTATCVAVGPGATAFLPDTAHDMLTSANAAIAHAFQLALARRLAADIRTATRELSAELD